MTIESISTALDNLHETLRLSGQQFVVFLRTHSDLPLVQTLATPWRWTIDSDLYAAATHKPATHLVPPHRVISNGLFVFPLMASLVILYGMFAWPYPRSGRVKQLLAIPCLTVLVLGPLLFICPVTFFHFAMTVASIATATRMVDLYFVQPWTGIPSRYYLTSLAARAAADATARSKKTDSTQIKLTNGQTRDETNAGVETGDFFKWDADRFKGEMWSPMRKQIGKKSPPSAGYSWKDLLPAFLVFYTIFDSIIYFMSFYTAEEMLTAPTLEYGLMVGAIVAFVIFYIRTTVFITAIVYSVVTGRKADPKEWTMLDSKLPLFAYSPADFWVNWQTLFRYIWIDLGFNPVQRFCKTHLGPDRLGRRGSQWAREILPVFAVFFLSAAMHAYIVYALWREPIWSQVAYFMINSVGVVVTKAIERSLVGKSIQQTYRNGSPMTQRLLRGVGILLTMVYHLVTGPFFIHPYQKQGMWMDIKDMSAFVRASGK
ncbi:hypothetical protein BGX29_007899 [Mortierella sp. GBA35]|nr:hypothetical protein BGX29_007899 [Mortierella sp. GBA35]